MLIDDNQEMVRDMARRFAAEKLAPKSADWDRTGEFPKAEIAEMGALGLMGMLVPEEWDGAMSDHVAYALALEEIAARFPHYEVDESGVTNTYQAHVKGYVNVPISTGR